MILYLEFHRPTHHRPRLAAPSTAMEASDTCVTGGAAFLHADVQTSLGFLDEDQRDNEDSKDLSTYGAVVGAGLEWALSRNVSFVTEGLWFFYELHTSRWPISRKGLGPVPMTTACRTVYPAIS